MRLEIVTTTVTMRRRSGAEICCFRAPVYDRGANACLHDFLLMLVERDACGTVGRTAPTGCAQTRPVTSARGRSQPNRGLRLAHLAGSECRYA